MRLLVTGSRTIADRRIIAQGLELARYDFYSGCFTLPFHDVLVHGDARGVDRVAASIWQEREWGTTEMHAAQWDRFGKRAGYLRNAQMVEAGADLCVAFIENDSRGATMCADLAEQAGIPTRRITVAGPRLGHYPRPKGM